jgi:hypothetical protein
MAAECPGCGGRMEHYDGGEAVNYEAELLICESCDYQIDLQEWREKPEDEREPLKTYITVY